MRKVLLSLISVVALAAIVACGGGSSSNTPVPQPPSTGNNAGFTIASLSGTYVFSASGATKGNSFATAGYFIADGKGNITSGTRDTVNDNGGQTLSEAITGTYTVNQDGRGQAVLTGSSGQVIYRFVLQSSTSAKLFQISNTADASGRIVAWPNPAPGLVLAQVTYVVRFDGEDSGNKYPYAAVGQLTFNATGNTVTGTLDENDNGAFSPQLAVTGSYTANGSGNRWTATYTTSTGTHNLIVYPVSQTHIEVISTDKNFFFHGYGEVQNTFAANPTALSGDQVFSTSGYDNNGGGNLSVPILETGRFTLDGAGNITGGIEDYNDAGVFFPAVTFGGTYTVGANGRWTASFAYSSSSLNLVGWQISPQQSLVMITTSNIANYNILETGTIRAQTTNLAITNISGNYAEDFSGYNTTGLGNVETTGNFLSDGNGNLDGTIDSQTDVSITTDLSQSGSYSVAPNGRSTGALGTIPVYIYTVDPSTIYLISADSTRLYQGKLVKQQ